MPHRLRDGERYTGQKGLIDRFRLEVPRPYVTSIVGAGTRQTRFDFGYAVEHYPAAYDYGSTFVADLKFALRREPIDLTILEAVFQACRRQEVEEWVRSEPASIFSRRAWFLYEFLTGQYLNVPDAAAVKSIPALDPGLHITIRGTPSTRHRVTDNLLGTPKFCPVIRRTRRLDELMQTLLLEEVNSLVADCDPAILTRAVHYLYTKETKSSYAIEGEQVTPSRAERFVEALRATKSFDLSAPRSYIDLQNLIVDKRYAATGWRNFQNFIGETVGGYQENVHCVFPKPEDVASLMLGLGQMGQKLIASDLDPVLAAAVMSFGFVFIHPFEDGNGRIHRFIIHHVLAQKGLTPPGIIFPISAPIVRNQAAYDSALETFSGRIMPFIDWKWEHGDHGEIIVNNDTVRLYRYFDATFLAEYLYEKVIETVRKDLREEIEFISFFDRARKAVMERIDMPDRRAALFIKLCMQNGGKLSVSKRHMFPELTDKEINDLENEIHRQKIKDCIRGDSDLLV